MISVTVLNGVSKSVIAIRHSHANVYPTFGPSRELSEKTIPTYQDMLLCCFEERLKLSLISNPMKKIRVLPIAK